MTVVLDTEQVPVRDRAALLHATYEAEQPPRTVRATSPVVQHRVERVSLGPGTHLLRTGGSALHVTRTARQVRAAAPEHVAIGLHRRGATVVSTPCGDVEVGVGHLDVVDMTRPYSVVHHSANDHDVLVLSNATAALTVDTVRAAVPALTRSPLYDLVRRHLAGLFEAAGALPDAHRRTTGEATVALVRAMLLTAASARGGDDALDDALEARIVLHLEARLGEPGLTVADVAAAHHISVRHLYVLWARAGHDRPPAEWLLARRLHRARQLLAGDRRRGIAAVARECGFADSSHFSRRFRAAYGVSPREWRDATAG